MHGNRLIRNTYSSLILQCFGIISGFIIPRFILRYYGSEVNGLVNSITQFLSVIAFLELGVGAVVQSSLYKPLAEKNVLLQSQIYVSAQKFFSKLARILVVYIIGLIFIYPYLAKQNFGFAYTAILICSMGIGSFAQYYFGIVNSLFLSADQRGYVQYNIQIITLVLNTVLCMILIVSGFSIQFVKLTTSIIYLARPIYLNYYVKKNYNLDKKATYAEEPIKQKWNGVAQHVAAIVLDGTDTIVLTVFATLKDVSVYSVYYLVVSGIKAMFNAATSGIQALLGDIYARGSKLELQKAFMLTEWAIHTLTMFIFGATACLITPFVLTYTAGITDTNYNRVLFGYIISFAYAVYCLRLPYHMMVRASGQYKETQNNYIWSASLNMTSSIVLVHFYGLIGVAIGTLLAMTFQVIWLAFYNAKKIVNFSKKSTIKQFFIDAITIIIGVFFCKMIQFSEANLICWLIMSIKVCIIWLVNIIAVNVIAYREHVLIIWKKIVRCKNGI